MTEITKSFFIKESIVLFLGFLVCFPHFSLAQNNGETQFKTQELQKEITLEKDVAVKQEEEQSDFGELVTLKKAKLWWITPSVSTRAFWTSNALLENKSEKGDTLFMETQGVNAGYRITPDWRIQGSYSYQLMRYDENPALDTDAHTTDFNTSWQLPWDLVANTGVQGLWITSPHQEVEVYREANVFVSFIQSHGYIDNQLNWFYGLQYDHKFTNPVGFERNEYTAFTGLSYSWLSNLVSQLVLRQNWQFYDFRPSSQPVNGRQEWISTVALQTIWQPLSWLQVSAFGVVSYDNSINATRDYKVANTGGEIRAFWKF